MTPPPELSRPVRLDALGETPHAIAIAADETERAGLARRFGLVAIERLEAEASCTRAGVTVNVTGKLSAAVTQTCVASGEPVPATVTEEFTLRFVPPDQFHAVSDEVELSEEDCDVVSYEDGAIDLGEAVAETLALALDPFPRSPDADAALRSAGVLSEEDAGPFAVLKVLRDRSATK